MKFNVTVYVNNGEGETEILKGSIEFSCDPNQYGNGYSMGITGLGEAFGFQGYDIRYDKDFNKDEPILYIADWYSHVYNGKDGRWKLIGIRVHEAEDE